MTDTIQVKEHPTAHVVHGDSREVRAGYTRTEVGVIPDEWSVEPLVSLCEPGGIVRGPFGGALKKEIFVPSGFKIYEQRNAIYKSCDIGSYFVDRAKYHEMQRFRISPGDFIISCSGTIGRIYQIPHGAPQGLINQALLKITTDDKVVDARYFYLLFEWEKFQEKVIDSTQGGAMKNLVGMSVFKSTPVVLPPLPEQHAIAEALSDVNKLLKALEALIEKKRAIKQGAMQQLLTGKTRLRGFSGEWKTKRLGEIAEVKTGPFGSALHEHDYVAEGTPIITVEHLGERGVIHKNLPLVSDADRARLKAYSLVAGDIVFSRVGSIDRNALIRSREEGWLFSGRLLRVRPDHQRISSSYLSYHFHGEQFKTSVRELAVGQTMASLNTRILQGIEVTIPKLPEQNAIAAVLSDMDTEIAALKARRDKTRAIKQGMMQQLLTGRIRLVKPQPAEAEA